MENDQYELVSSWPKASVISSILYSIALIGGIMYLVVHYSFQYNSWQFWVLIGAILVICVVCLFNLQTLTIYTVYCDRLEVKPLLNNNLVTIWLKDISSCFEYESEKDGTRTLSLVLTEKNFPDQESYRISDNDCEDYDKIKAQLTTAKNTIPVKIKI